MTFIYQCFACGELPKTEPHPWHPEKCRRCNSDRFEIVGLCQFIDDASELITAQVVKTISQTLESRNSEVLRLLNDRCKYQNKCLHLEDVIKGLFTRIGELETKGTK